MIKKSLIKKVAKETNKNSEPHDGVYISLDKIEKVLISLFKVIEDSLLADEEVPFLGIGKFETIEKSERIGTNPQTKEKMIIEKSKYPHFKISRTFKEKIINKSKTGGNENG